MKRLSVAIIGQGRSGRNIHGKFFMSDLNDRFDVKFIVEREEARRKRAEVDYPGCRTFAHYTELYPYKDEIDLVVNVTYSDEHYSVSKALLEQGFNVFVDKPFCRSYNECQTLIKIAEEKGVTIAVFQQSFYTEMYRKAVELIKSGRLGEVKQINVQYNGFARRWDWQTVQACVAGGLYNTGPHPVGIALGLIDFDENVRVAYSKLACGMTSGDGDDFAKVILDAPGKPTVDIEVSSLDAYSDFNIKLHGSRGSCKLSMGSYKMKYVVDSENEPRPVIFESLRDEKGEPIFCKDNLVAHEEEGKFELSPFLDAVKDIYFDLYYKLTEGREMEVTAQMAASIISVIETAHAQNPLPIKFTSPGKRD